MGSTPTRFRQHNSLPPTQLDIAAPLAGVSKVQLSRSQRGLYWHYESTMGIPPGKDENGRAKAKALRDAMTAKLDRWVQYLKKQADADGSGFVSTEERPILRRRIERGVAVSASGNPANLEELTTFLGETPKQVAEDLAAYRSIRAAALRDGMEAMPELPWPNM